jgi:hypothetical protein
MPSCWSSGASGRAPALQTWGPELKPQNLQNQNKVKNKEIKIPSHCYQGFMSLKISGEEV